MHKRSVRETAESLRSTGYSYTYISRRTGVSKSTLSGWLAETPYTPNAVTLAAHGKARAAAGKRKALLRQEAIKRIRKDSGLELGPISKRDLMLFGLGLYLGEGCKTGNVIRIVNSDPGVIRAAIAWFCSLGVRREQFAPRMYVYPDSNLAECLRFWSKTTRIPKSQFLKQQVDRRSGKKASNAGKLPYGTLHLGVRSNGNKEFGVEFFRKIQAWNEHVLSEVNAAGLV